MAKNSFPGFKSGGGIFKKILGAAVVLAIVLFIINYPTDAADVVDTAKDSSSGALDGLVQFFRSLSRG